MTGLTRRRAALAALALLTALAVPAEAQTCDDGLKGWRLRSCLRAHYKPASLALDYDAARDALFADVERRERAEFYLASIDSTWSPADSTWAVDTTWTERTVAYVEGLYGGAEAPAGRPAAQAQGFNTEHVIPQSRGAGEGNARADLHHLFPAHGALNAARSNHPFGEADDAPAGAAPAYLHGTAVHSACPASPARPDGPTAECSVVWRTGTPPLYLDGEGLANVRPSRRGDVARAAFYAYTMYQVEVEDALPWPEGREWFEAQKRTLLDWHEADPPDAWEVERTWRAAAYQGGRPNPYVTDPGLVRRALFKGRDEQKGDRPVWINEVHATNAGRDRGEGVELAGRAGTDLYAWRLFFYGARGHPYDPRDTLVTDRATLDETVPHEAGSGSGALGAVWQPVHALWNRCNGLALFDPDLELAQFLSYGGCQFNAVSGPVHDWAEAQTPGGAAPSHPDSLAWSQPVLGPGRRPVQEWDAMPVGYSLQLTGAGSTAPDFAWGGPHPASPGRLNDYQAPASGARTTRQTAHHAPDVVCPDLESADALACVARGYRPARLLSLAESKDRLYDTVDRSVLDGTPGVVGLYSGLFVPFDCDPSCDPSQDVYNGNAARGASQEHVWPRSRGADGNAAERDLHHLFPARSAVNSARGNLPFAEVPDSDASAWYAGVDIRPAPPADRDAWSERGGRVSWEPREDAKGDVARALLYIAAVYADLVDLDWFEPQRETLLAWHAADPPSSRDAARSDRVAQFQAGCAAGPCVNPFVADPSLADRAFGAHATSAGAAPPPAALVLGPPRPNPARGGAVTFALASPRPARVRATVLDALGRAVAVAHDGPAPPEVRVEAGALPAGAYVLRLETAAGTQTQTFTVAR